MQRFIAISPFVMILAAASLVRAAEKVDDNALAVEIRKTVASLEESFNRGDAKSLAALWTPDGDFIGPGGERIVGVEKIEAAFQEFLASHKDFKLRLAVVAWRRLADDVVVADVASEMTPAPKGLAGEPRSTMLLVRRDGRWPIASVRETVSNTPSHYGCLKELGWLVGDWSVDAAGVSVHSTCDWTANGSFMIRKFTIEGKTGGTLSGTEVIGWDPRAHRIHSWTFESDGSFGESVWTRDGDRWIIKYDGVLADGSDVAATHVLTRVDANAHKLQSTDRRIDGEKQPDIAEVSIKRCPAPDAAKPKSSEPAKPPRQVLP